MYFELILEMPSKKAQNFVGDDITCDTYIHGNKIKTFLQLNQKAVFCNFSDA
jgi:hypothetical protein